MSHAHPPKLLPLAIAIFSMFFGAGNTIFPLLLGVQSQDQFLWAFAGLLLTGIGGPLLGLLGSTLFRGRCVDFFFRLGKLPGSFLIAVTLSFLGPLAVLPRCTIVAYNAMLPLLHSFPQWLFAILFSVLALLCCWRRRFLLATLGYVLSPTLILCLCTIIYQGLASPNSLGESGLSATQAFTMGFAEGYNTMDLIASIYFASGIWTMVSIHHRNEPKVIFKTTLRAGALGCLILAIIYLGLSHAAARFAVDLQGGAPEEIMTRLTFVAMGPFGGMIANVAIALACLTTVMSLTMTISDILASEIAPGRIHYRWAAPLMLMVSAAMTNVGFESIMAMIYPVVTVCYPLIIVLTMVNIMSQLRSRTA